MRATAAGVTVRVQDAKPAPTAAGTAASFHRALSHGHAAAFEHDRRARCGARRRRAFGHRRVASRPHRAPRAPHGLGRRRDRVVAFARRGRHCHRCCARSPPIRTSPSVAPDRRLYHTGHRRADDAAERSAQPAVSVALLQLRRRHQARRRRGTASNGDGRRRRRARHRRHRSSRSRRRTCCRATTSSPTRSFRAARPTSACPARTIYGDWNDDYTAVRRSSNSSWHGTHTAGTVAAVEQQQRRRDRRGLRRQGRTGARARSWRRLHLRHRRRHHLGVGRHRCRRTGQCQPRPRSST